MYQETISQSKLATSAASYMKRYLHIQGTVNDIVNDYCHVEVCDSAAAVILPLTWSDVLAGRSVVTNLSELYFIPRRHRYRHVKEIVTFQTTWDKPAHKLVLILVPRSKRNAKYVTNSPQPHCHQFKLAVVVTSNVIKVT